MPAIFGRNDLFSFISRLRFFVYLFAIHLVLAHPASAQGAINYTGNGGKHTIQGRIYTADGRRSSITGLKIRLISVSTGDLIVFADSTGTFAFKNMNAGSYSVVIDESKQYEDFRESVYIDDPGSSNIRGTIQTASITRVMNVQVYLRPRSSQSNQMPPSVINAELAKAPKAAVEFYENAQKNIKAGNFPAAITELEQAIKIFPGFSLALNELGVLYGKTGSMDKAVAALRSAVKFAPDSFKFRLNLGLALFESNNYDGAETQLAEAVRMDAQSIRAHLYLGFTKAKRHDLVSAELEIKRALELDGGDIASAHYYLGGIYWASKKYRLAADELEKYLKLDPATTEAEKIRQTIADLRNLKE